MTRKLSVLAMLNFLSAMIMITILDSDTYVPEIVLCINAGYLFLYLKLMDWAKSYGD